MIYCPTPSPQIKELGSIKNKKDGGQWLCEGGVSVSVYFLKPINDEAAWRERKTKHGCERLFLQLNGQISDSVISTSTYQNTHTCAHTQTLRWRRKIQSLKIQDNIQEGLWIS